MKCQRCGTRFLLSEIPCPDCSPLLTEANQPKAESGTTACLAAGCGPNEETAARLADWQARWHQLLTNIEVRLSQLESMRRKFSTDRYDMLICEYRFLLEGARATEEADA